MITFNKYWNKRLIIIIGIVFVILISIILYLNNNNFYESDYFGKIGIKEYKRIHKYLYKEMLNDFGEPISVTKDEYDNTKVIYNDLIFTFLVDSPEADVKGIKILSPKYRFGYRSISVGSSKKDVFKAYARVPRSPDKGYIWNDRGTFAVFEFENDIVKTITIFYGV